MKNGSMRQVKYIVKSISVWITNIIAQRITNKD